jgi:hypothetical protein
MSNLLAYTTEISDRKSVGEIIGMLAEARASAIQQEFDGFGNTSAISFRIYTDFGLMSFRMPVNLGAVDQCLKDLYKAGKVSRRYANDSEHSRRVAWRILRHWLEAQLALIKIGQTKIEQVFLAYAQGADGKTLFESLQEEKFSGLALPSS